MLIDLLNPVSNPALQTAPSLQRPLVVSYAELSSNMGKGLGISASWV